MIEPCPKCNGFILKDWDDRICVNCGFRPDVMVYVGTMLDIRRGRDRRQYKNPLRRRRAVRR